MHLGDDIQIEQPILWLGMTGFSAAQRDGVAEVLAHQPAGWAQWRIASFAEADAWWVNGSRIRLLADGNLKVAAGMPTEQALKIDLGDVDRPVAFSTPLAAPEFDPLLSFDPASEASMLSVLQQFEGWLRLLRARFVIGAQMIRRRGTLRGTIHHLNHQGKLLAVVDLVRGQSALLPNLRPVDLWSARWDKRPATAHDLPESFVKCSAAELVWAYVRRTDRDLLPERYREDVIYYRSAPRVPLGWLTDSQLMLLRELNVEPGSVPALRQRTGLPLERILKDLSCLYYANSITTTPARAGAAGSRWLNRPEAASSGLEGLLGSTGLGPEFRADPTAPAPLGYTGKPPPPRP